MNHHPYPNADRARHQIQRQRDAWRPSRMRLTPLGERVFAQAIEAAAERRTPAST